MPVLDTCSLDFFYWTEQCRSPVCYFSNEAWQVLLVPYCDVAQNYHLAVRILSFVIWSFAGHWINCDWNLILMLFK